MNVKDEKLGKVECHDRGCPGRPCYHPLCMAHVHSRDYYQCIGWDGNEEPCPGKMPKTAFYCGDCKSIKVTPFIVICNKYKRVLRRENKKIFKCFDCLQDKRLKWFKICDEVDVQYSDDIE